MKVFNINDNWQYKKGLGVALGDLGKPQFESQIVMLPHDAVINSPHNEESPNGSKTGFYDSFGMNYTRTLVVDDIESKVYYLAFDGVYCNAFISVNDCAAGKCHNGYAPFTLDITPYLEKGENVIKVVVKNDVQTARWYSGGGIYRDVNLLVGNAIHILPDGVRISTESIAEGYAVVRVNTEFENCSLHKEKLTLITEVCTLSGETVAKHSQYYSSLGRDTARFRTRITVNNPKL